MNSKRTISLLLAIALTLSLVLAGCGGNSSTPGDTASTDATETGDNNLPEATGDDLQETTDAEERSYAEISWDVYQANLGEFYEYYSEAKEELSNLDLRYALMAIAEAKLLESSALIPTVGSGGLYGMTRKAIRTSSTIMWGTDDNRYHSALVTNEPFKTEDVAALKALWAELRGTGTYLEKAKEYLDENGYTTKDSFAFSYTQDPKTWDILATSLAVDNQVLVNTYDGLLEYDCENVQQPALAEGYDVSSDGLTYTFHIRQGVKWVDSQGREIGEVTADDWVASLQHLLDAQEGLEFLVDGVILNASEYISGEITDFSLVGVKAADDYTLVYTLAAPNPYFPTLLGYSTFAPLNRAYYQSQGGTFGQDYAIDGAGNYGTSPDNIAYCGPYLITNWTAQNIIAFTYNESYWNPDNVNIHAITWLYNDGSDPTKSYNDFLAGTTDVTTFSSSTLEIAKEDGNYDQYAYVSDTTSSSFYLLLNLNRGAYANFNDATTAVSPKAEDEEEQARTNAAVNNVHFRRALAASIDRLAWNAQDVGDDLAAVSLRNSYVPGTFVFLENEVTVEINGVPTTFPAGTYYGEILQAQLDADEVPFQVWTSEIEGGSGDGFDGWYHPEYAVSELALAVEELAAEGVVIDAEHPIQLDLVYASNVSVYTNKAMAFKQSVETVTEGLIVINTVAGASGDDWLYATYYPPTGAEGNYDINDCTGWGPDYGDPSTYLDTLLPEFGGFVTKGFGIY